jgi:hypothetical protein
MGKYINWPPNFLLFTPRCPSPDTASMIMSEALDQNNYINELYIEKKREPKGVWRSLYKGLETTLKVCMKPKGATKTGVMIRHPNSTSRNKHYEVA